MVLKSDKPSNPDTYRLQTLRPWNSLLFILPPLLLFQAGTYYYGTGLLAHQHLHKLLKYFGATAAYLPAVTVGAVLMAQHFFQKPTADSWKLRPNVLAGMFGESVLWMIPLMCLSRLTGRLVAEQTTTASGAEWQDVFRQFLLGIGAGIYEEFLFRLVFVTLAMLIFVDVFGLRKEPLTAGAVIVAAVAFSLYHFSGPQLTDPSGFPWTEFAFRAAAGMYLGGVFIFRGFGIAVGTHAFYNIYVLIARL